jgi:hypothetical protein
LTQYKVQALAPTWLGCFSAGQIAQSRRRCRPHFVPATHGLRERFQWAAFGHSGRPSALGLTPSRRPATGRLPDNSKLHGAHVLHGPVHVHTAGLQLVGLH